MVRDYRGRNLRRIVIESHLLAAALRSRESSDLIQTHLAPAAKNKKDERYSPEFRILTEKIKDYYKRDDAAQEVQKEIFLASIDGAVANEKHRARFKSMVEEAFAVDTSVTNTNDLILQAKKYEVGDKLAMKLVNREDVDDELLEYTHIHALASLDDYLTNNAHVLTHVDLRATLLGIKEGGNVIKLRPQRLNEAADGGVGETSHVIFVARPNMGKSAMAITIATAIAMQGKRVLYFINEDDERTIQLRLVSCFTGLTKLQIMEDVDGAIELANQRGMEHVIIIPLTPGTLEEIDAYCDKYEPDAIIVDQMRNLVVKGDGRTSQLEAAAVGLRNIGKRRRIAVFSFTQAGDSAEGKAVLSMSDVDNSKTGIPGACDMLLGIGATLEQKDQGIRIITPIKNKSNNDHATFPLRLNPFLSRYTNV